VPRLINKYTFGATAASGCSLVYFQGQLLLIFPGGGGLGGSADDLHINIMPIPDPLNASDTSSYPGLIVRPEKTSSRPVAAVHNGVLFVAYSDLDTIWQIHILAFTSLDAEPTRISLPDTSPDGMALTSYMGQLVLAFTGGGGFGGGPPNTHINIMWSPDGYDWSPQRQMISTHTSVHTLSLAALDNPANPILMLAFTGTNNQLYLLHAHRMEFSGANGFDAPPQVGTGMQVIGHSSDSGPALASFNRANLPSGGPDQKNNWFMYLLWHGIGDNQLNCMNSVPNPYDAVTSSIDIGYVVGSQKTFSDTTFFAPAVIRYPGFQDIWLCAWAGTDDAHRLNIARIE
jgi:hypothetical protein